MKEIPLTRGKVALIDDRDFEEVSKHCWRAVRPHKIWYACGRVNGEDVYLHRLLLGPPEGKEVDHINGDGLDNRRANLRVCTHQQNLANARKWRTRTSSRYKGVTRNKQTQKWIAQIEVGGENRYLGTFEDETRAAAAYNKAAAKAFGQFARLNEI